MYIIEDYSKKKLQTLIIFMILIICIYLKRVLFLFTTLIYGYLFLMKLFFNPVDIKKQFSKDFPT